MQDKDPKVFFSYARADSEFALRLAEDMRAAGVDLWIDQLDIPTGARWDQTVENALKACPYLLVILSPASVASQNVMDEVAFAIEENKKILPVLSKNCEIPFRLKRLQHIDFTVDYGKALKKLLTAVAVPEENGPRTLPGIPAPRQNSAGKNRTKLVLIAIFATLGLVLMANIDKAFSWLKGSSEWMISQQYQEAFESKVKEGYYPYKLEGTCDRGIEKFRVEWKAFPLGSEGFVSHHGVTKDYYELKNHEYISKGLTLESLNSFKDCSGNDLYQANWFRRSPVADTKIAP